MKPKILLASYWVKNPATKKLRVILHYDSVNAALPWIVHYELDHGDGTTDLHDGIYCGTSIRAIEAFAARCNWHAVELDQASIQVQFVEVVECLERAVACIEGAQPECAKDMLAKLVEEMKGRVVDELARRN